MPDFGEYGRKVSPEGPAYTGGVSTGNHWQWFRVSKRRPCACCGSPDWCTYAENGVACCMRVQSERQARNGGWLHGIEAQPRHVEHRPALPPPPDRDWESFAAECAAALPDQDDLHAKLGVSPESLARLGLGWSHEHVCYTFPMFGADGRCCGIRTRYRTGAKRCVAGSRAGLFIPDGFELRGEVWVCEGPTDCAALLSLGFNAVGRPNNTGGYDLLVAYLRRARDVVIVADRESRAAVDAVTVAGADRLLVTFNGKARMIRPPGCKDVRDWLADGATAGLLRWHARNGA